MMKFIHLSSRKFCDIRILFTGLDCVDHSPKNLQTFCDELLFKYFSTVKSQLILYFYFLKKTLNHLQNFECSVFH